jgi:hypothetical protein
VTIKNKGMDKTIKTSKSFSISLQEEVKTFKTQEKEKAEEKKKENINITDCFNFSESELLFYLLLSFSNFQTDQFMVGNTSLALVGLMVGAIALAGFMVGTVNLEVKRRRGAVTKMCSVQ